MSGYSFRSSLVAARVSVVVAVDLDAISGIRGDGGCEPRGSRSSRGGCGIWAFGDAETVHSGHTEPSIVEGRRFGIKE